MFKNSGNDSCIVTINWPSSLLCDGKLEPAESYVSWSALNWATVSSHPLKILSLLDSVWRQFLHLGVQMKPTTYDSNLLNTCSVMALMYILEITNLDFIWLLLD